MCSEVLCFAYASFLTATATCVEKQILYQTARVFQQQFLRAMSDEVAKAKAQAASPAAGETIFSKIIRKEIPAEIIHEDDKCIAIRDVNPQAPVHCLVIPREPIKALSTTTDADTHLLGHLMVACRKVAEQEKLSDGYRIVINDGMHGAQSVPHLHIHIMGKRQMRWPPG